MKKLFALILAGIMILWQQLRKKKLSPITLICLSGVLGMILYGL